MQDGVAQKLYRGWRLITAHSARSVRSLVSAGADFLSPPTCALCGREVTPVSASPDLIAGPGFCPDCLQEFESPAQSCRRCAGPVGPNLPTDDCPLCRDEHYTFRRVYSLGLYEKRMRSACLQAQDANRAVLAAALAGRVWDIHADCLRSLNPTLVVPVPRWWWKRWRRSHYVPNLLADTLGSRLRVRVDRGAVVKTRHTPDQNSLSPTARRTNLRGAFTIAPGVSLAGQTVLLVDDVLTTGSTANEVSKALLAAGAKRVDVAVIARGVGLLRYDRQNPAGTGSPV